MLTMAYILSATGMCEIHRRRLTSWAKRRASQQELQLVLNWLLVESGLSPRGTANFLDEELRIGQQHNNKDSYGDKAYILHRFHSNPIVVMQKALAINPVQRNTETIDTDLFPNCAPFSQRFFI
ncbi:hypothetical protein DXZ20_06015 [Leptolyngbyaceae cyanobacterium CCMR0081]|uniref:Uncharacterized protein n=1 Tax=Adonisia turfae CCMR0081 TaxID=2292702 RepID=A0A6M0RGH7_9CYAN|nr:hypothetical protein [Adonisia turfae CCMR0081]